MSAIYGVLGVDDTYEAFLNDIGQELVFGAINQCLSYHRDDVAKVTSLFVKGNTEKFTQRWPAPGAGMLTPMGQDPTAPPSAVQRTGYWDVSYPLRGYGNQIAGTKRALARMTLGELDAQIDTITERSMARHRRRVMIALMESTNLTFADIVHGNLTIRRLANGAGDSVTYPVLPGATVEATDDHYIDAAYTVANIATATNPAVDLRDEIIEHFGGRLTTGTRILYIHGTDQTEKLAAIDGYVAVGSDHVNWGDDTDLSRLLDGAPGWLHGTGWGVWLAQWAEMPDEFGLAVHLDYPPLMRRVDRRDQGLPVGLNLVAQETYHPLQNAIYEEYYGYGVGNRLSAACIEINGGDATYEPPTAFSE